MIWKLKENASRVFKIRLSNELGIQYVITIYKNPHFGKDRQTLGENGTCRVQSSETLIEIAFSSSQQLISNETPEDHYVPSFFHVQCNIASPVLINDTFLNCLATIQLTENERCKYLRYYVPKHILYIPVRVASFREIHFRFTNQLNQTLMFSDSSSVIVLYIRPVL